MIYSISLKRKMIFLAGKYFEYSRLGPTVSAAEADSSLFGAGVRFLVMIVLATVTIFVGCTRTTGIPTRDDVVGVWMITEEALAELRRHGYSKVDAQDHRVELKRDGSCDFRSYWEFDDPAGRAENYVNKVNGCSWRLGATDVALWRRNAIGAVTLDMSRFVDEHITYTEVTLQVERREGHMSLVASIGHPDDGRLLYFVRR